MLMRLVWNHIVGMPSVFTHIIQNMYLLSICLAGTVLYARKKCKSLVACIRVKKEATNKHARNYVLSGIVWIKKYQKEGDGEAVALLYRLSRKASLSHIEGKT